MKNPSNKEYYIHKMWQLYAPYYYDYFINVQTPSLAIAFDWTKTEDISKTLFRQQFVYGGIRGTGIGIGNVILPNETCLIQSTEYHEGMIGHYEIDESLQKRSITAVIPCDGDINRIKYVPQTNYCVVQQVGIEIGATVNMIDIETGEYISIGKQDAEGFGIGLNSREKNKFATTSNGGKVTVWDANKRKAISTLQVSTETTNDIDYNVEHNVWGAVSEDSQICFIDEREMKINKFSGGSPMNAITFSPFLGDCMATGHNNGMVKMWDMRNTSKSIFCIHQHKKSQIDEDSDGNINTLQFSPHLPNMLLSSSTDKTVNVYDLGRMGKSDDDSLIFTHSPHHQQVYEARWNPHTHGIIGSVAEDYSIHVWKYTEP